MPEVDSTITVVVERPAVGGAMLARHEGAVVLVEGAIPGETVRARVHSRSRNVTQATVVDVVEASPDRVAALEPACGGRDYAHIARTRQRVLKREQVMDALRRIAKRADLEVLETAGDDRDGYRLRARLHWDGARLGFLRAQSHQVCVEGLGDQLSVPAAKALHAVEARLASHGIQTAVIELGESVDLSGRTIRLSMPAPVPERLADGLGVIDGLDGALFAGPNGTSSVGRTSIEDTWDDLGVAESTRGEASRGLTRQPHAFFQGHRFLVPRLVREVLARIEAGTVVDLYAGVGLFGLAAARRGIETVTCVESDPVSCEDLTHNAESFGPRAVVVRSSVERWLFGRKVPRATTMIVDPPRTGLSAEATAGLAQVGAMSIVYVSCDLATFARDVARLTRHGFEPLAVQPLDLFPDTGHVEVVVTLNRSSHA